MRNATLAEFEAQAGVFVKELDQGPVVVTENGKPTAVLLSVTDEDEVERLVLAYSPEFEAILEESRQQIREGKGIPHDEFWRSLDEEYGPDESVDTDSKNE